MKEKKDTSHTIKRAEKLHTIMIGEGLAVGIVAGLTVLAYRIALSYADTWLQGIIKWVGDHPLRMAAWIAVLLAMAVMVSVLVKWEPMISGSGIPQLEGEMTGKLEQTWWKVLPAKFAGGFLCLLGGLSLGREGPSIQLGAMTAKGLSRGMKRGMTEEKFLLTCGASAGLSAAFHAPLAGVMFSLEEIHKNFSATALVSVMTASLSADFIASNFIGIEPVFQFEIGNVLPHRYYWMLILLGILLGILGAVYNWSTLKVKGIFEKMKKVPLCVKLMVPFLCAGVLGFANPQFLGSGHNLIISLTNHEWMLGSVIVVFAVKFLFSVVSFGSGAPGGIFFPMLVLGSLIGGTFGLAGVEWFGMDMDYVNNLVLLSMAGYFTAIVRAPLTGIILIFEMTGNVNQMLSLSVISIVAYITAELLKSESIYESLLKNQLASMGYVQPEGKGAEKVLSEYAVMYGSTLDGVKVKDITWPKNCLLVSVKREGRELIPRGNTTILASDILTIMTDVKDMGKVYDAMNRLRSEKGIRGA